MKIKNSKKNSRKNILPKKQFICPNCKVKTAYGHFVPPSLGKLGFWICDDRILKQFNKIFNT